MPYQHLTLEERSMMAPMRTLGWSIRAIATQLGCAPSTISRELRRNSDGTRSLCRYWAHRDAQRRRQAGRPSCLTSGALAEYVQEKLRCRWSPEQIAHRVRLDSPHASAMRISHQTDLYVAGRGSPYRRGVVSIPALPSATAETP